jgi:hypothetical protein
MFFYSSLTFIFSNLKPEYTTQKNEPVSLSNKNEKFHRTSLLMYPETELVYIKEINRTRELTAPVAHD